MKKLNTFSFLLIAFLSLQINLLYSQTSPDYIFGSNNAGSGWNWTTGTQGTASLGGSYKWQFQATANDNEYFKFGETSSNADGSGFWYVGSGGDVQYPGGGSFGDKWTAYYHANMNDAGAFYFSATSGNYYVIKARKQSGSDADFVVMYDTAAPVNITNVSRTISGNNLNVTITTSAVPSAGERFWLRYSTNNWSTSNTVQLTGSGTSFSATVAFSSGDFVSYYVYSTFNVTSAPAESDADLYTINYNNNNGVNYTVQIGPLTGNYYIPQGSNAKGYSSLASAIQNLNENGASGTVRFLIDGDLSEDGTNLLINRNDLSATNNLIIKPAPTKTPTITITNVTTAAGANQYTGLAISNTNYVTIDGSNTDGGNSRDLTLIMDASSGRHAVQLYGNTDNITIKNLKIKYLQIGSTTSGNGIFVNGQSSGVADNCTIMNCEIGENSTGLVGPVFGISFTGFSTDSVYCKNGSILNNIIYGRIRGISTFLGNDVSSTLNISGNLIGVLNHSGGTNVTWGCVINVYKGTVNIYNNTIISLSSNATGTQGIYGIGTLNGKDYSSIIVNVYNNLVGGNITHTGSGTPASIDVISFQDAPNGSTCNVYYNTVVLNNMTKTASSRMTCIRLAGTWAKDVKNNIFINKKTGTSVAYCILMGATTGTISFDYNNYYLDDNTNGNIGYWTSAQKTLTNWKTASGQDANSINSNVAFISATDFHIDANSPLSANIKGKGTYLASYNTDIDGDTRKNPPDLGADEFQLESGTISDGGTTTYSTGGIQRGAITWHGSNLPSSVNFTYYPQSTPPGSATGDKVNQYWVITNTGGSGFTYDLTLYYDENQLNGISESDLRVAKSEDGGNTYHAFLIAGTGSGQYQLNTTENWIKVYGLNSFSQFTLTSQNNPLPVEVTSFNAYFQNNQVKLIWTTSTETNNYGWEIERSKIDKNTNKPSVWQVIGFVKGSGTSNSPKEYSFVDNNVLYGQYAYRLKQIDIDGGYSYSEEVRVFAGEKPQVYDVKAYPNPFNPQTTIRFELPEAGKVKLSVYDITGQLVTTLVDEWMEAGVYERQFDGSRLASGIYISVMQANGQKIVRKMQLIK